MADERKRFIIQTIYESQGLKEYNQDLQIARSVSSRFGIELSNSAKILEQTTTRSFTRSGEAVARTTAIINDSGRNIRVTYDQLADRSRFVSASFVNFKDNAAVLGNELGKLIARAGLVIPVWLVLRSVFTGLLNTIRDSIKFLSEWEFQMAQIRIVSNNTEQDIQNLSRSLLTLSRNLGISNKDIGEGAKLYVQQGLAIKEIIPLMDATAKLSLLTGRSITQSVEDLTAVLKAYKLESTDAIKVVDALTNVELVHAVTTEDLTEALKQVASTAATTGVSLESLIGFITAIKSETRDTANRVGLSLRTMFARLSTSSAEALQSLTGVPFFLDETGKTTTKVTPVMRNLESIITELAVVFKTLTNAQKAQVADLVGGTHRLNQAFALFNNFTESIEAQADALFSLGKSDKAIGVLTDTMEIRVRKLKGAWDEFVASVANTSGIKKATGALTDLIQGTTAIVNPDEAFRTGLIDQLTTSQQQATRQQAFSNALLDVKQKAEDLAKIVERNPKAIEQARIQTAIWAERINQVGKEFGISVDRSVELPGQLAESLNQQLSKIKEISVRGSLDVIRRDIQKDLVNISTDIKKIISENFSEKGLLGEGTFQGKGEGIFDGLVTAGLSEELKRARRIFIDFQKGIFISPGQGQELKNTFKNLLDEKNFADFSRLVDDLVKSQESLNNVESRRSRILDDINKKLQNQNTIQQSTKLTEDQIEEKLLQIEREGIKNNTDRLEILNKEIGVLKSQGNVLEDTLDKRLKNLETEKLTLEASRKRAEVESRQKIALNELRNQGATNLQILTQELAFLEQINAQEEERRKKREEIAIESQNVKKNIVEEILGTELELLKAQGANDVQVIQTNIELEKKLGIEKRGLDALKEQLDLIKAINKEEQKPREERLKDLSKAIIDKRKTNDQFGSRKTNLDFKEANLTFEAKLAGLSDKEINKILNPASDIKAELPRSIQGLANENDKLGINIQKLASTIDSLTDSILQDERKPLELSGVRPILNPDIQTKPTVVQPKEPKSIIVQSPADLAPRIVFSDGAVKIEVKGTESPEELEQKLNEAFGDISKRIARQFTTAGTELHKAFKQNFERE